MTELSLGHNVVSRDEVDAVMAQVAHAGARIVKPAQETFWVAMLATFKTRISIFGMSI